MPTLAYILTTSSPSISCYLAQPLASFQIDINDSTIKNAFFHSFDTIVRMQLDPIWHRIGQKTKQLISDLKIRSLLGYLMSYDCITFNAFLKAVLTPTFPHPRWCLGGGTEPVVTCECHARYILHRRQRVYTKVERTKEKIAMESVSPGVELVLEEQFNGEY